MDSCSQAEELDSNIILYNMQHPFHEGLIQGTAWYEAEGSISGKRDSDHLPFVSSIHAASKINLIYQTSLLNNSALHKF